MAKIMLVEDDNNLREIYGARLLAEGHEIVSAKDGEEALAIAVKEKPELIISDVMMPKISGFDMLDILRNAPETKYTKVIMMTALSQAEDKARADNLGADRYLVKSQVTLEDVARAVRDVLEGKTASESETVPTPISSEPAPETTSPEVATPATPEPAPASAEVAPEIVNPTEPVAPAPAEEKPAEIEFPQIPITPPSNTPISSEPAPETTSPEVATPATPEPAPASAEVAPEIVNPTEPVAPVGFSAPATDTTTDPQASVDSSMVAPTVVTPTVMPTADPASDSTLPATPESTATKIEVTLPSIEEKAPEAEANPEPTMATPETTTDPNEAQIGDNLNAIMQKELEGDTPAQTPVTAPPEEVITPDTTTPETNVPAETPTAETAENEASSDADSSHKKIVIQPINDLTKPKLDASAAQEEPGVGTVANPSAPSTVVAPTTAETQATTPPTVTQPSEHDIISL